MKSLNVLVVGAGGIGCELLKNLVLENFEKITVIDLDTIDISNLNRQFLFQRCHVGKSKAEVACESVRRFRPSCDITAIHKSILSSCFNTEFFESFDLVFNALDNRAARRHVNRLCVAAKRPLIESGTAGYLGQVEPLLPTGLPPDEFRTGCYECQPRGTAQRTYPACTIRNTPSEPVHCVVWAKYLFNQLFGEPDVDDEDVSPDFNDPELKTQDPPQPTVNGDTSTAKETAPSLRSWFQSQWDQADSDDKVSVACALVWRLFHDDIVTLIGMKDLWKDRQDRREPTPLDRETLDKSAVDGAPSLSTGPQELRDQRRMDKCEWLRMLLSSVVALQRRSQAATTPLTWDKDDDDSMDFVAAASVLRAQLFHLPGAPDLTRFTVKSLAGNIIPAIATTNAIIAGIMVLQARHVLANAVKNIRSVYVQRIPAGRQGNRRLVAPCDPPPSNPACYVCGPEATKPPLGLVCLPSELTLRVLRDHILIRHLGMLAPDVEVEDRGVILISSEEGETDEDTLNKTLADFGLVDGCRLLCDDFQQDFQVRILICTTKLPEDCNAATANGIDAEDPDGLWRLVGDVNNLASVNTGGPTAASHTNEDDDDDEVCVISDSEIQTQVVPQTSVPSKRPRFDPTEETVASNKRTRLDVQAVDHKDNDDEEDVICLD